MACILCISAVRVHDSQAYRKIDVTRERIRSYLGTERNAPVVPDWFQPCAAVVCAILETQRFNIETTDKREKKRENKKTMKASTVYAFSTFTGAVEVLEHAATPTLIPYLVRSAVLP